MVEETRIFVGYFRRNLAAGAIAKLMNRLVPDMHRLKIRSKYTGSQLRYCCVTFESPDSAQAALSLLNQAQAKEPRLVTRLWFARDKGKDRRGANDRSVVWSGSERRRSDRRGPRWFTRPELERLLAQATPGKWQGRTRLRPFKKDAKNEGYVEVRDPALNSRVKICDVARKEDRRLVSAAPDLALQCLFLLKEMESANETGQVSSRRLDVLLKAKRESGRRHSTLKRLYEESLGQRLFLLAVEADDRTFRRVTKKRFIKEVQRLEVGLRSGRRSSSSLKADDDDDGDSQNNDSG